MSPLDALAALDAHAFGSGLSPANARAAWASAIDGARSVPLEPLEGLPRTVTLIASANVFTAPLEWAWALSARGVRVILKSARGLAPVGEAIAAAMPGVEARDWRGGDLDAEAAALAESDAVVVFGSAATIEAIRARSPVPVLGFGPRFGVAWVESVAATAPGLARDHALYDGRGCMSPAAVFAPPGEPLDALVAAMADAEGGMPRGVISAEEAAGLRSLALLARVEGRVWHEGAFLVAELPLGRVLPRALPRAVVVHRVAGPSELATAIAPWRAELGTLALQGAGESDLAADPALAASLGLQGLPPARLCAPGEMQRPPGHRRFHDGLPVLRTLAELKTARTPMI